MSIGNTGVGWVSAAAWLPGSEYLVRQSERRCYYNVYLARGQYEKALLVFNSALAYGLSNDTYQAVERIDAGDPGFCPLQPNASGNGRLIEMMRRMVIDEQDADKGILWLLRGCPRQWFAEGKSVVVENAPTLFGQMAIRTESDGKTVTIDIDPPRTGSRCGDAPGGASPGREAPKHATVNGAAGEMNGDTLALRAPQGHLRIVLVY